MNQGRIWCVVNPTVGLPLFLGSVALTSLAVHYTVLTHTTWMGAFFEGGKSKAKASLEESVSPVALNSKAVPGYVISVAPVAAENARLGSSFVVTVAPAPAQAQAAADDPSRPPDKVSLATLAPSDEK
jgi:light-harvesting protein B-800-850 alpha chain